MATTGETEQKKDEIVILVTRFNGTQMYINAELIQTVEATPDTIIALVNNSKILVKEPPQVIIERVIEYRTKIWGGFLKKNTGE